MEKKVLNVILWGSLWGIFEATIGYLLHLLPFSISWLIWYPVSCFFMANVYRKTGDLICVLFTGLLCASIKLVNLLFPVRIDQVINPVISIVFESMAMVLVIWGVQKLIKDRKKNLPIRGGMALFMNTLWRLMFIVYLLLLVPDWMQEISVISSKEKFLTFFVTRNLLTSGVLLIGYQFAPLVLKPIKRIEKFLRTLFPKTPIVKYGVASFLLCFNILLELLL